MEPNTLEKLKKVRAEAIKKFDGLSLFVVIKRVDTNLWDFVFAGKKLDNSDNLKPMAEIVSKGLDKNEAMNVSRVVLLNSEDPFAMNFNSAFSIGDENGYATIKDSQINNIHIKEAYLFFSKVS